MATGRWTALVAATLFAVCAATEAPAQYPGGGSTGARPGKGSARGPAADDRDPAQMAATAAGLGDQARIQLHDLEEDLKLAPAQRAGWIAYSDKVQKLADDVFRARNTVRFPKGSAPEQLDFIAETLRNRLTAVEDIVDAGKAFYALLTPEQKTIADGRLARISIPLIVPAQPVAEGAARAMRPGGGAVDSSRGR